MKLSLATILLASIPSLALAAFTPTDIKPTGATFADSIANHLARETWAQDFGVKCDGIELNDVTATNGSAVISSASRPFTQADVGKTVEIFGSSSGSLVASSTIISVSSGNATMAGNALLSPAGNGRMVLTKTDDTAAINAAITATSPKGGIVKLPAGYCVVTGITLKRQVILEGKGMNSTVLYLKAGSNADVVRSENFASLTGTGLNYGPTGTFNGVLSSPLVPSWYGLKNLQLDGNRLNQTGASNGYSGYGNAQFLDNVLVTNFYSKGFFTEASGAYAYNAYDWRAQEEGFFGTMIARNGGEQGWLMRGPHDSTTGLFLAYDWGHTDTTAYGFENGISGNLYNGSAHFGQIHPYTSAGTKNSIKIGVGADFQFLYSDFGNTLISGSGSKIDKLLLLACGANSSSPCLSVTGNINTIGQITGAWQSSTPGTGLTMVSVTGTNNTINGFTASSIGSTTDGNTLLSLRGSFNKVSASLGNMSGTNNVCADLGGSYNVVEARTYACTTHTLYTASGFENKMTLSNFLSGAEVALTGTFSGSDIVQKGDSSNFNFVNVPGGAVARPGLQFSGSTNTGLYGNASAINFAVGGVNVGSLASTGLTLPGMATAGLVANSAAGLLSTTTAPVSLTGLAVGVASTAGATVDIQGTGSSLFRVLSTDTAHDSSHGGLIRAGQNPGVALASGDRMGALAFSGTYDTSGTLTVGSLVSGNATELWTSSAKGANLIFETTPATTTTRRVDATLAEGKFTLTNGGISFNGDYTGRTRVVSGTTTMGATDYAVGADTTSAAFTLTLPTPVVGKQLVIFDAVGTAGTNNITIDAGSGKTVNASQTNVINAAYGARILLGATTTKWVIVN